HEIVNDVVANTPVVVTFCPLCNTAIAFDRRVQGHVLSFGTTGNLRDSDLVMYDRQTESWWQQFGGDGIVGRYAGARLRMVPARLWTRARSRQVATSAPHRFSRAAGPFRSASRSGSPLPPFGQTCRSSADAASGRRGASVPPSVRANASAFLPSCQRRITCA